MPPNRAVQTQAARGEASLNIVSVLQSGEVGIVFIIMSFIFDIDTLLSAESCNCGETNDKAQVIIPVDNFLNLITEHQVGIGH